MKLLITIILLFNQIAWANKCPEDIQVLEKGQVANCDGLLFSPEASKKADEAIEDVKYYKSLTDKLGSRIDYSNKETEILEKRLKLYIDQSNILADQMIKKENEDKWQKVIWFGLGVIATGAAFYGASHLND